MKAFGEQVNLVGQPTRMMFIAAVDGGRRRGGGVGGRGRDVRVVDDQVAGELGQRTTGLALVALVASLVLVVMMLMVLVVVLVRGSVRVVMRSCNRGAGRGRGRCSQLNRTLFFGYNP